MPSHNEYFSNAVEGQNKAAELVGYIFPVPLRENKTTASSKLGIAAF